MRHTMKWSLVALASLALVPTAANAVGIKAPHPGTVTALTYYSSGAFHGAVDISSGDACNYWDVHAVLVGSVYWNVTINTSTIVCYGNGSGNQNEAKHVSWYSGYVTKGQYVDASTTIGVL